MSSSVALSVFRAVSFASEVVSTKANIAVALITGVRVPVSFVKMILDNVVYRTISHLYLFCFYSRRYSAGHAGKHAYV
jgi:hypothetical protein